ncbi:MAG: HEAT repeat domain-containing protein, partial [Candidatus Udaeobacter sp.]
MALEALRKEAVMFLSHMNWKKAMSILWLLKLPSLSAVILSCCFAQTPTLTTSDVSRLIVELRTARTITAHNAGQQLAEMGASAQPAFPALVVAARTRKDIRDVAIYAIGRIAESLGRRLGTLEAEAALPILLTALSDTRDRVREVAAYAVGRLAAALVGSNDSRVERQVELALISRISDRQLKVQRAAVEALGYFGEYNISASYAPNAAAGLAEALTNSNRKSGADAQQVQIDATAALGKFRSLAGIAVPQLRIALQSGIPAVQRSAAYA